MILRRLYELAQREGLLQDPAFDTAPIACLIQIGEHGEFLGIVDQREKSDEPPKRKGGKPKPRVGKGKLTPVPIRPVVLDTPKSAARVATAPAKWKLTDPANNGKERPAVFLSDCVARVLPVESLIKEADQTKNAAQRSTFWRFVEYAASETRDPAMLALCKFGDWLRTDHSAGQTLANDIEQRGLNASSRCTFAWLPDDGLPIIQRSAVVAWWRSFFVADRAEEESDAQTGYCQVTGRAAVIPATMQVRVNGLFKFGCRPDVNLVAGLDAADSYDLEGARTSMVSREAIDGVTRALNALIGNTLPGNPTSSLAVGRNVFLFWTRLNTPTDFMALDQPRPEQVARLMRSPERGRPPYGADAEQFYLLAITGNSKKNATRLVVCDYLETSLPEAQKNLGAWFQDLEIVDWQSGERSALFPLRALAIAASRDGDDVAPDLPATLMSCALRGSSIPIRVLGACLRRIRAEVASSEEKGRGHCFRPARMALMQLILRRLSGDHAMADSSAESLSLGYACGQLLAFLARCQSPRDFGASAQVLARYFGAASASPRSVFPLILRLNRHHIRKIREEGSAIAMAFAENLERELEARLAPFRVARGAFPKFPAILTLPEQGSFALGFYHQRADYRAASVERRAAQEAAVE